MGLAIEYYCTEHQSMCGAMYATMYAAYTSTSTTQHISSSITLDDLHNSTTEDIYSTHYNPFIMYTFYVVRHLFSVIGLTGNTVILLSIKRMSYIQAGAHILVASLAVSDIVANLMSPLSLVLAHHGQVGSLVGWRIFCMFKEILSLTWQGGSVYNIFLISFDRFLSVTFPIWYISTITKRHIQNVIVIIWIWIICQSLASCYWSLSNTESCRYADYMPVWFQFGVIFSQFTILSLATMILYIRIAIVAWKKSKMYYSQVTGLSLLLQMGPAVPVSTSNATVWLHADQLTNKPYSAISGQEKYEDTQSVQAQTKQQNQILQMMSTKIGVYLALYLPAVIIATLKPTPIPLWYDLIYHLSLLLLYANAVVNPFIYAYKNKHMRTMMRKTIHFK